MRAEYGADMTTLLAVLVAWFFASIVLGLVVGYFLRRSLQPNPPCVYEVHSDGQVIRYEARDHAELWCVLIAVERFNSPHERDDTVGVGV